LEISRTIVYALENKKGEDILLLDIRELAPFADFFIICSGTSDRMLAALADTAIEATHKDYHIKGRIEGQPEDGWLLVDFGDVVLHLFSPDRREYYQLEDLWSKGKVLLHLQ
jgi:ribosome-associated protein